VAAGTASQSKDEINLETHQFGKKAFESLHIALRRSVLEGDVLAFHVA
jgi:hypothetical protein